MSSAAERVGKSAWAVYAAMGLVLTVFVGSTIPGVRPHAGYNLVLDGIFNNVAYLFAPLVCWVRARNSQQYRVSWRILAVGLLLYGLGNVYWTIWIRPLDPEPFPTFADGLWLSFYPCAFAALLLLLRERTERLPASLWLDGVVGGLAVAAGAAAAFVGPILSVTSGGTAAVITTTAYPLLDVLLLFVVVALLALFHWRPPPGLWFLTAGLVLFVVADAVYLVAASGETYEPGGLNDAVWVLATVLVAFAPGWKDRPAGLRLPAWAVLGVPIVSTLGALALLIFSQGHRVHPIAIGLAAATVVAALARLSVTFREVRHLAGSHELALTDELTSLGNRRSFYDAVLSEVGGKNGDGRRRAALLLLDLDRFKEVNDSLGHHAGDKLLEQVGERLAASVHGPDDHLARLGGDEFAMLLLDVDRDGAVHIARRVGEALTPPFQLEGVMVRVDVSIGIALAPEHGTDVTSLLRRADIAMYHAKARRAGHHVYDVDSDALGGQERLRTLEELRSAINTDGLVLHYQPKVDARRHTVTGVEALVRWDHPTRGMLAPSDFLPLVEDAGLMPELTHVVLRQALDQVSAWRNEGRELRVAVNLSAVSLVDAELPNQVFAMLRERKLPPETLELEITEDSLLGDRERARGVLAHLRMLGVRVAVDDFGTGYSSLAYLRELPIDELKLDRSFVMVMGEDPRSAAIVRSTIELAHALGLRLVAEGVEDGDTAMELARFGCDEAQGYFFSRPLPAPEFVAWLDRHSVMPTHEAKERVAWGGASRLPSGVAS
jgi:diguanylate cyclase (GGDEF)-like protein